MALKDAILPLRAFCVVSVRLFDHQVRRVSCRVPAPGEGQCWLVEGRMKEQTRKFQKSRLRKLLQGGLCLC